MPANVIIEIGDRYISNFETGDCGFAFRAVVKFTHDLPALPSPKNKKVQWMGPVGLPGDKLQADSRGGEWGTAELVKMLRALADGFEQKDVYQSSDKITKGDLLTVMTHELGGN